MEYDPFALDAWALGCIIAQMYTPIALLAFSTEVVINVDELKKVDILDAFPTIEDDDDSEEEEEEEEEEKVGGKEARAPVDIRRQTLFNGSMGDLGLIWSIVEDFGVHRMLIAGRYV